METAAAPANLSSSSAGIGRHRGRDGTSLSRDPVIVTLRGVGMYSGASQTTARVRGVGMSTAAPVVNPACGGAQSGGG